MATVPTYLETQQRVALRPEYTEKNTVLADADSFGAAVGRGMQQAAAGLDALADAREQVRRLQDEAVVKGATNEWFKAKDDLLYNTETGYANTQGKQAVDEFDTYKRKVTELRNKFTPGMSPSQTKIFGEKVAAFEADATHFGMEKRSKELKSFVLQEHTAAADGLAQQALQDPLNEDRWSGFIGHGLHEIEQRGIQEGWGEQRAAQERNKYISDARSQAALQIAMSDPIRAARYATEHAEEMSPQDRLALLDRLKPDLTKAAAADAAHFSASNPGPGQFAAKGLSQDQYALLSVISGTESPGYDVMNGGQRFKDFAAHPGFVGAGGTSTASGRYQFIRSTWEMAAKTLGLTDFSPASQDRAAAWLAQRDYRARTGRDLNQDIAAGNYAAVKAGLGATWDGIAKISDADFAKKMGIARSSPFSASVAALPSGGTPTGSRQPSQPAGPRFSSEAESVLAGLPQAYADEIRASAMTGVRAAASQEATQQKALQVAQTDAYKLRIANDDQSLTVHDINDDTVIDDGDKALLINSLNEKNKGALETRANVAAFQAGNLVIDAFSEKGRKANDEVWNAVSASAQPSQVQPLLVEQIRQTGAIPSPVINAMRSSLASKNVDSTAGVLSLGSKIAQVDVGAFARSTGGSELADDVALYSHYTNDIGLGANVAAQRILDRKDPEKVRARSALMDAKPMKDAIDGLATEANVRATFSRGMFSRNPSLGNSPLQSAAIVSDYRDTLVESIFDAGGDVEAGTKLAADRFNRRYGTSAFAMGGPTVVSRLPPEKTYPADANGSHAYIRDQLNADLQTDGTAHGDAFLVADSNTETDMAAGFPPRYQVYYKDENGILQHYRKPFYAVAPTPQQLEASKSAAKAKAIAEVETLRQQNLRELEAGRDRDANLDQYLAGPPSIFTASPAAN